jgi:hypothetical protein
MIFRYDGAGGGVDLNALVLRRFRFGEVRTSCQYSEMDMSLFCRFGRRQYMMIFVCVSV